MSESGKGTCAIVRAFVNPPIVAGEPDFSIEGVEGCAVFLVDGKERGRVLPGGFICGEDYAAEVKELRADREILRAYGTATRAWQNAQGPEIDKACNRALEAITVRALALGEGKR